MIKQVSDSLDNGTTIYRLNYSVNTFGKHTYVQEIWKMEGWAKIGVQRASVLYPNSCYNEPCYIEVQVYIYNLWLC